MNVDKMNIAQLTSNMSDIFEFIVRLPTSHIVKKNTSILETNTYRV